MKHPEGAFKTINDLRKAVVPGNVLFMVFDDPQITFKVTITENTRIVGENKKWYFRASIIDMKDGAELHGHEFWSPYGSLHFPTIKDRCGYLFANYWRAYAYTLKLEKAA